MMAWTTPRTWTDGETVTAAIMNTHLRDNFQFFADEPHELWLSKNANQAITANTTTAITWQVEDRDVGFGFTPPGSSITVQQTGIYAMHATVQWSTGTNTFGAVGIEVASALVISDGGETPGLNEGSQKDVSCSIYVAASTAVRALVFNNTATNVESAAQAASTRFHLCQTQRTVS